MTMPELTGLANRDPVQLLVAEARYKPDIADLIDRIDSLSYEDIDALPILIWRRKALKGLKDRNSDGERKQQAERFADQMGEIKDRSPIRGSIQRYLGPETVMKPEHGLTLTLRHGELLFISDEGDVWCGTACLGNVYLYTETVERDVLR